MSERNFRAQEGEFSFEGHSGPVEWRCGATEANCPSVSRQGKSIEKIVEH